MLSTSWGQTRPTPHLYIFTTLAQNLGLRSLLTRGVLIQPTLIPFWTMIPTFSVRSSSFLGRHQLSTNSALFRCVFQARTLRIRNGFSQDSQFDTPSLERRSTLGFRDIRLPTGYGSCSESHSFLERSWPAQWKC
jgi:hypothetical protein